ncbi:MAG: hypothetical protein ABIF10_08175 [Candidatus Woesearchaeota archaeon]
MFSFSFGGLSPNNKYFIITKGENPYIKSTSQNSEQSRKADNENLTILWAKAQSFSREVFGIEKVRLKPGVFIIPDFFNKMTQRGHNTIKIVGPPKTNMCWRYGPAFGGRS